jgi:hypothetical protein
MQLKPDSIPIAFVEALREVEVIKVSLSELERKWGLREQEAYARGVADGERALSEQLVQQRAEHECKAGEDDRCVGLCVPVQQQMCKSYRGPLDSLCATN